MNPVTAIILTLLGLGLLAAALYLGAYYGIGWLMNKWDN